MTKKDFELIAAAVVRTRAMYPGEAHRYALNDVSMTLADALATTNPRFDRAKFLQACGVAS